MELESHKRTSRIAVASVWCAIAAILSIVLFAFFLAVGLDWGVFVAASIGFGIVAFLLGIASLIVIIVFRRKLKGFVYATLAVLLSSPFIFLTCTGAYVAERRAERQRANTGHYNLRLLGKELIKYARGHNGCLPAAEKWCDLLMEYNSELTKSNFKHPRAEDLKLRGSCHFAFNKNLSGMRLAGVPGDVVLLFEADGDWNLTGAGELLKSRRTTAVDELYVEIFCVDKSIETFWFHRQAVKKLDPTGKYMSYKEPSWKP